MAHREVETTFPGEEWGSSYVDEPQAMMTLMQPAPELTTGMAMVINHEDESATTSPPLGQFGRGNA